MPPTVSTKSNHSRYERAMSNASGKLQHKGGSTDRELSAQKRAHWSALRNQTHASSEHLTQTVLDAVAMCYELKKTQFSQKNTKKLLRNIMTRKSKDMAFSQFYQVCDDFSDWKETINFLTSCPKNAELNVSLAFVARQIINSVFPKVEPHPPTKANNQLPPRVEHDTIHPLYECAECDHQFHSEIPIDENHCTICNSITHDARLVDKAYGRSGLQFPPSSPRQHSYLDGSIKFVKLVGFANGFELDEDNETAIQQTIYQIEQLIETSQDKIYFIWDNDQDGNGALQYVLRQLCSTYSYDYIGFIRVKRETDPDNLIREMEHFEVTNIINTTSELSSAPDGDWSFHGKIGIDKIILQATEEQRKLAIFFVGGATTAFATCQEGQPEGEAPYYERTYPDVPLFINDKISRNGQTSKNFGWTTEKGAVFQ